MGRTPRIPLDLKARPFSLDEARAAGLSLSALRGKTWRRLGSRMYCWVGTPQDNWSLIEAWWRALPESAVFVGRTAAWMHRLDIEPANPVEVALPADLELRPRDGLRVRRSDVVDEIELIRGIPATRLERTLLDICARSPASDALVALDMAFRARLTNSRMLQAYVEQVRRPGAARLRSLAELAAPAESPMETRLRWVLLSGGLPTPEVQSDLYDGFGGFVGRADLYYESAHLVVEFDGGNHRERLVGDDRRQNLLVGAGYRVLRFTAADVYGRPEAVVAQVRAAITN